MTQRIKLLDLYNNPDKITEERTYEDFEAQVLVRQGKEGKRRTEETFGKSGSQGVVSVKIAALGIDRSNMSLEILYPENILVLKRDENNSYNYYGDEVLMKQYKNINYSFEMDGFSEGVRVDFTNGYINLEFRTDFVEFRNDKKLPL